MDPDEDLVGFQKMYKDYRETAKALFHESSNLEFDDGCKVSKGTDNGAYVARWKWVSDDELDEEPPASQVSHP